MKKILLLVLTLIACLTLVTACGTQEDPVDTQDPVTNETGETEGTVNNEQTETVTLKVGASITPHAEILNQVVDNLAEQGITLEVIEFTDYVQPNLAVESGDLDANYFQHTPYMLQFNEENGTHLVDVADMHYEAMGIYCGKLSSLDDLYDGATIAIPNDATNEARALLLLADNGVITMKEGADLSATILDIEENPYNIEFVEMEAAQITLSLEDVDFGVINGNYALQGGLTVAENAVATETSDSEAATTYPNVLCVKEGNEENEAILALIEALQSDEVRNYINEAYGGVVVPLF